MRVLKTKRGKRQDKPLLSGNEAWCSQHNVVVVAGQPIGQWVVLEGCSVNLGPFSKMCNLYRRSLL